MINKTVSLATKTEKTEKPAPKVTAKKAEPVADNMISLVAIAKKIQMDPKRARAKARKSKAIQVFFKDDKHWVTEKSNEAAVAKLLTATAVPTPKG